MTFLFMHIFINEFYLECFRQEKTFCVLLLNILPLCIITTTRYTIADLIDSLKVYTN